MKNKHFLWIFSGVLLAAAGCQEGALENALTCEPGLEICGQSCCADTCIDNVCVNTKTDNNNCGEAGRVCTGSQVCTNGECLSPEEACGTNQTWCKGDCVNIQSDVNNCGGCGITCEENESCKDGSCFVGCSNGYTLCDGQCIDTKRDSEHCGGCAPENACVSNQICLDGHCACPRGYYDCDGDISNGCESTTLCEYLCEDTEKVCGPGLCCDKEDTCCGSGCCPANTMCCGDGVCADVINDAKNCGNCGITCEANEKCENAKCVDNSNAQCEANPETGEIPEGDIICWNTCVHSLTDSANCGACGNACDEGYACETGKCVKQCASADETACGDTCYNLNTDVQNCGTCGNICPTNQVCTDGACADSTVTCEDAAQTACWGTCANLQNDPANCGACGIVCDEGLSCVDGTCKLVCPKDTEMVCNGVCVDVVSNPKACSDCGIPCPHNQICVEGGCTDPETPVECGETMTNCWNVCVDITSDTQNCGGCGIVCNDTQTCTNGVCTDIVEDPDPNACDAPNLVCYGICTDVMNDDKNCGACLNACGNGEKCENGVCEIQCGELTKCGAACVDTHISNNHCGSCGVACKDGESCIGGDCQCAPGRYDCDGIAFNGCESTRTCTCTPGTTQDCWLGQADNRKQGACKDGTQVCDDSGLFWKQCTGGTYPSAITCNDAGLYIGGDQNCNGIDDTQEECVTSCDLRLTDSSYIGCEYWAAYTENNSTDGKYAVILSNMGNEDAQVTIYQYSDSTPVITRTVKKGSVETFVLAADNRDTNNKAVMLQGTVIKPAGFRIVSTRPVTAYQFNPLRDGAVWNDALLLLPKNVYGQEYYGIIGGSGRATYMAIQATSPGKTTFKITPNRNTTSGSYSNGTSIPALNANQEYTYTLNQYDVFQLTASDSTTGTKVTADRPFVAISGCRSCYNAKYLSGDVYDHYSEQLFPYQSWGSEYALAGFKKQRSERDQYRILSKEDAQLTITPTISSYSGTLGSSPINIKAGQPYDIITASPFHLKSTKPILVAGFLGDESSTKDPSYSLVVPVQQYRSDYSFMVPADYNYNYITITAPKDIKSVKIYKIVNGVDNMVTEISNTQFTRIGNTNYSYYMHSMGTTHAAYKIIADKPIGVQSYGYYSATSYAYPLGLNLTRLNNTN